MNLKNQMPSFFCRSGFSREGNVELEHVYRG
jgi:hypothetical protein